jgi:hypothetical protein
MEDSESVWKQIGEDINGEAAFDNSGSFVSLSADGTTVAIESPGADGGYGKVRVLAFAATIVTSSSSRLRPPHYLPLPPPALADC